MFERLHDLFYHRPREHVVLVVDGYCFELHPHWRIRLMVQVTAGQKVNMAIAYLNQHGAPMSTPQTPDSPSFWSEAQSIAGIDMFTVAADGNSAEVVTAAAAPTSQDIISLSVSVGGHVFSATLEIDIAAQAEVLTSVEIVPTVS